MVAHHHLATDIAKLLLQINAIKLNLENPFRWASGLLSPIYCDNRRILSYPDTRRMVVDGLSEVVTDHFPEAELVAGVATGAIAHGVLVAEKLGLPFIYVRRAPKGHGLASQIEGHFEQNQKTVVVEDLVSTAKSSVAAIEALSGAGLDVKGMVAIFTYGLEVAAKRLQDVACPFISLSNYQSLLALLKTQHRFAPEELIALQAWRENPEAWSDARLQ